MKDFDLLDQDEQALMKKPRPIGWFAAGAVGILALGFTFAFYVPLSSAHDRLLGEHEKLAQKSHELDHALKGKTATLASTEERREKLARFLTAGSDQEKSLASKADIALATANNDLGAFTKAKLVEAAVTPAGLTIKMADKVLFRPRTSSLLPQAKRPVCAAAGSIKQNEDWLVRVTVPADLEDKKYWETAGERAAALAQMLEEGCGIGPNKIQVAVVRPAASTDGLRTTITFGPSEPPLVKGSQAPLGDGEPASLSSAPAEK